MRKHALLLLAMLVTALFAFPNKVIIKGIIQTPNGTPVAGKKVWISSVQSNNAACNIKDSTKTNPNGYFIDSLKCEGGDIRRVEVTFINCEGILVSKNFEVPVPGIVELKLTDCAPPNTLCDASFKIERTSNLGNSFSFTHLSAAGATDEVIRRVWSFGDGTFNEGNSATVKKEYLVPGVYEVCLKITTRSGCTKSSCQKVEVPLLELQCQAAFVFERIQPATANTIAYRFNSSPAAVSVGDEIVSRNWTWGDGSTLTGNEFNPVHVYSKEGAYEVCLVIKTRKGCESRKCQAVLAQLPKCKPLITFEFLPPTNVPGTRVRFNSKYETGGLMHDSIISRSWIFGDGKMLQDNVPNPLHLYEKPGEYRVCLVTKTRFGCVSEVCMTLIIPPPAPVHCQARFRFEARPDLIGYFTAAPSLIATFDSVVKTIWTFGDGQSMTVNGLEVKHQYTRAGIYEVCMTVITKTGCENKWCGKIEFGAPNNQQPCGARFTYDNSQPGRVVFNSQNSFTTLPDDRIESRRWDFGNGRFADGNLIKAESKYPFGGRFVVCLSIKTAKGCESKICQTVEVKQGNAPMDSSRVWLVRIYPNPVREQLSTVIYSPKDNEDVEISVLDVYGIVKSGIKIKVQKGYTIQVINTRALLPGPYVLRIRSAYGVQSLNFYKFN